MQKQIVEMINTRGELNAFAWPGGYPIYYLDRDNSVLCSVCANESLDDDIPAFRPVSFGIIYDSDDDTTCDQCSANIR